MRFRREGGGGVDGVDARGLKLYLFRFTPVFMP